MNTNKPVVSVVIDGQDQKHFALEGLVKISTPFGGPAKLAIYQTNILTPFGNRLVTTVWMFPYTEETCTRKTTPKDIFSGSTMLSPVDTFSYRQAVINALIDLGQTFVGKSYKHPAFTAFGQKYGWNTERMDKAVTRWAKSTGRTLFHDEFGDIGDLDNNEDLKIKTFALNQDNDDESYIKKYRVF